MQPGASRDNVLDVLFVICLAQELLRTTAWRERSERYFYTSERWLRCTFSMTTPWILSSTSSATRGFLCPLEPQVFDILLHLIQHRDRVVSREELLEYVWPERFISEATLDHRVMEARQAIGDSGQRQGRIKTLRGRGYRFVASVEECSAAGPRACHTTAPQTQGRTIVRGCPDSHTPHADARLPRSQ